MKEVKLGTYQNRQKAKNQEFVQKIKKTEKKSKKTFLFLFLFGLVFCVGVLYFLYSTYLKDFLYGNECTDGNCSGGGGLIQSLIDEPELKKTGNLTSVLLIGIDTRKDQQGLMNTDTIMVITYDHSTGNVFMTSIPRDMYVKIPAIRPYWSKINAVYAQGVNDENHETGISYLKTVVEEITGLTINYHAMINYDGFLEVIDEVGGIEVCVERTFSGNYPKGIGWESVHFDEGCQEMDGVTALKYARTRYTQELEEGNDYARAKRQQKVIIATKDKVLKAENLLNPLKLSEFVQIAGDNIQLSSYNQEDVRAGIKLVQSFDNSKIVNIVLEPSIANGKVIHVIPGDAYIIGPTTGDWSQVREFVQTYIKTPKLLQENAEIYIYNGGAVVGAAGVMVEDLVSENPLLNLSVGGNTVARDHVGVKIYDFSGGTKSETLSVLQSSIPNSVIVSEIPEGVNNAFDEDIVVIVGGEETEGETATDIVAP